MKPQKKKAKIGIVGCGAIGSRMARSITTDLKNHCQLVALYDIDLKKAQNLSQKLSLPRAFKRSYTDLLRASEFIIEAVNADDTYPIIQGALKAKKNILSMSVGKLLGRQDLFRLAEKKGCRILIPSGAIAGIDAIKAAGLAKISSITLTTRKPPAGFFSSPSVIDKRMNLNEITGETVIFDGDVDTAVKLFPHNINVAATLALASGVKEKMSIRIITSPDYKTNSHEIEVTGDFGRITTRTDNAVCPDNPKTSYLAVLSAIQTLKQFFGGIKIGT